jgi:hypothetical protein
LEPAEPTGTLTWEARWEPDHGVARLADQLGSALDHLAIVDLLVYGSHANNTTTGFSDLDAVLVIDERAAEDAATLRELRPRVLAAQRAVQAHQPMQHHGFEVGTPKLLASADAALELPREAMHGARSVFGRRIEGGLSAHGLDAAGRLASLVAQLSLLRSWPRHPWRLHSAVSMFELMPALYLQAGGVPVSKANSFAAARDQFRDSWWPYEVLAEVREVWPRRRNLTLEVGSVAARNPWVAVAAWTRLPSAWPVPVRTLLTAECLTGLQDLARQMVGATR